MDYVNIRLIIFILTLLALTSPERQLLGIVAGLYGCMAAAPAGRVQPTDRPTRVANLNKIKNEMKLVESLLAVEDVNTNVLTIGLLSEWLAGLAVEVTLPTYIYVHRV